MHTVAPLPKNATRLTAHATWHFFPSKYMPSFKTKGPNLPELCRLASLEASVVATMNKTKSNVGERMRPSKETTPLGAQLK